MSTYLPRPDVLSLDGAWSFVLRDRPEDVAVEDLTGPTEGWAADRGAGLLDDAGLRPAAVHEHPDAVPGPAAAACPTTTRPACTGGRSRVPGGVGRPADRAPRGRGRDGAVRARRRRARRHGQGLAPAARVRPHRRRRARRGRSSWRSPSCAGPTPPTSRTRTTGTTPASTAACSLYATPPVHVADVHAVADYDPATGDGPARAVRVAVGADGHGPTGWTVRVDAAATSQPTAPVALRAPDRHASSTGWCSRGARPTGRARRAATSRRGRAEAPNLHHLDRHAPRRGRHRGRRGLARRRLPAGRGASATSCSSTGARC